jgi:hypothetical protein
MLDHERCEVSVFSKIQKIFEMERINYILTELFQNLISNFIQIM